MILTPSPRISETLVLPSPHDESSGRGEALSSRPGSTGTGHPALATLTALCRGDAALAELIRAVAASLESERLVLNDPGMESVA